mmetsp:Transcript_44082/g.95888  ORF Transcript_44082/g.95888 Transcript_44082/m.95888 type:complete len:746 (+) Transcript_44082:96-2333(+)
MRVVVPLLVAGCTGESPVAKVVKTIEDLKTNIKDAGTTEAGTYDTFACFCKDTTKEKSDAITDGATEVDTLVGDLEVLTADKKKEEKKIKKEKDNIEKLSKQILEENNRWTDVLAHYTKDHTDISTAVTQVNGAIDKFASGSFMQLGEVQSVLRIAEAMRVGAEHQQLAQLLQKKPEDLRRGDFESHTGAVTKILDDLKDQFETKKSELESEHTKQTTAHGDLIDGYDAEMTASQDDLTTAKTDLAQVIEDIADKKEELTEKQQQLYDDQVYLKELSQQCETKAKMWDQRVHARNEELEALDEALAIINGDAKANEHTLASEETFLQLSSSKSVEPVEEDDVSDGNSAPSEDDAAAAVEPVADAKDSATEDDTSKDEEDEAELPREETQEEEDEAPSFLQVLATKARNLRLSGKPNEEVAALLEAQAAKLNSPQLSALAGLARAPDPFKKVKILIQKLIENLLEEGRKDAEQKGWCDTEMSRENKTATLNRNKVAGDSAAIEEAEATKASKEADIEELQEEITTLKHELGNATELRADEKKENEEALEDAQSGSKAVQRAIVLLKDHYKKAETKARVFNGGNAVNKNRFTGKLLQVKGKGVSDDAPDAGFSKGYKGDQEGGKGVIGTLEELRDQFNVAAKTTAKNEKEASDDHVAFSKETKSTISSKETSLSHAERDLADTKRELTEQLGNLKKHQELCDNALEALDKLVMKCIDAGMDYDERKRRREEEIAALHKAIELFNKKN